MLGFVPIMKSRHTSHRLALAVFLVLALAAWADGLASQESLARGVGVARAAALLDGAEPPADGLAVVAEVQAGSEAEASGTGGLPVTLGIRVTRLSAAGPAGDWSITVVATVLDDEPWVRHETVTAPLGAGGLGWVYLADLELPLELQDAVVVVEERASGRWGAGFVEVVESLPRTPSGYAVLADRRADRPTDRGAAILGPPVDATTVVQLVVPAARPVTGRARFRAVVTTAGVARTVFYLDGVEAAVDEREPFSAVLDLGPEPRPHQVRVVAFGPDGNQLGEDTRTVNARVAPFEVRITALEPRSSVAVRVVADVSVPPWEELDRVEFYRNDKLIETLTAPPFTAEVEPAGSPADFVRVVAHLAGGESREDARLYADGGQLSERIEVNLVEVYAVVTDREGEPVRDLERDRFRLRRGRQAVEIERFGLAEEVPLVLGLMIDSSLSMWTQMIETRQAAARFVAETLEEEDRAFVVDFDTRPRVAQGLTNDVTTLLRSLGSLAAGGATAIYDAASFSLNQFEREPGRRALVLLTDGRDQGSSLNAAHCARDAKRLGVPLYILVLSPEVNLPGLYPRNSHRPKTVDFQLEALARETGGRLFFIERMEGLGRAYSQINAELRSQYLLAFSTPEALARQELDAIKVDVEGRGLKVRTVTLTR